MSVIEPQQDAEDQGFLPIEESLIDYDDEIDSWNGRQEVKPP
jgi:hypothetical protein